MLCKPEKIVCVGLNYRSHAEETGGGYGAAVRFAADGERRIAVTDAKGGGCAIGFCAWADFLSGKTHELNGRWLSLREIG